MLCGATGIGRCARREFALDALRKLCGSDSDAFYKGKQTISALPSLLQSPLASECARNLPWNVSALYSRKPRLRFNGEAVKGCPALLHAQRDG